MYSGTFDAERRPLPSGQEIFRERLVLIFVLKHTKTNKKAADKAYIEGTAPHLVSCDPPFLVDYRERIREVTAARQARASPNLNYNR